MFGSKRAAFSLAISFGDTADTDYFSLVSIIGVNPGLLLRGRGGAVSSLPRDDGGEAAILFCADMGSAISAMGVFWSSIPLSGIGVSI